MCVLHRTFELERSIGIESHTIHSVCKHTVHTDSSWLWDESCVFFLCLSPSLCLCVSFFLSFTQTHCSLSLYSLVYYVEIVSRVLCTVLCGHDSNEYIWAIATFPFILLLLLLGVCFLFCSECVCVCPVLLPSFGKRIGIWRQNQANHDRWSLWNCASFPFHLAATTVIRSRSRAPWNTDTSAPPHTLWCRFVGHFPFLFFVFLMPVVILFVFYFFVRFFSTFFSPILFCSCHPNYAHCVL